MVWKGSRVAYPHGIFARTRVPLPSGLQTRRRLPRDSTRSELDATFNPDTREARHDLSCRLCRGGQLVRSLLCVGSKALQLELPA